MRLGEGELKSGGHRRPSILADALEAVFGAIFLDAGFDAARDVILHAYRPLLEALDPSAAGKDPKTALQEWLQGRHKALPVYSLVGTTGDAHAQAFEVGARCTPMPWPPAGRGPAGGSPSSRPPSGP